MLTTDLSISKILPPLLQKPYERTTLIIIGLMQMRKQIQMLYNYSLWVMNGSIELDPGSLCWTHSLCLYIQFILKSVTLKLGGVGHGEERHRGGGMQIRPEKAEEGQLLFGKEIRNIQ